MRIVNNLVLCSLLTIAVLTVDAANPRINIDITAPAAKEAKGGVEWFIDKNAIAVPSSRKGSIDGSWIKYKFTVKQAGKYKVGLVIGSFQAQEIKKIYIDGREIGIIKVDPGKFTRAGVTRTGYTPATALSSGEHSLKIVCMNTSGWADKIRRIFLEDADAKVVKESNGAKNLEVNVSNKTSVSLDDNTSKPLAEPSGASWLAELPSLPDTPPQPWSSLQVRDKSIKWLEGKHSFGNAGLLPRQLTSQSHELLASPVKMELTANNALIDVDHSSVKFVSATGAEIKLQSKTTGKTVEIEQNGWMEFDGFLWNNIKISPVQGIKPTIQKLDIVIPVKSEYANFFHSAGNYWSDAELLEVGTTGWRIFRKFKPVFWLGNGERGISWFAESKQNWHNSDTGKAVEVIKNHDTTYLKIHLIDAPQKLSEPLTFSFGLMVNPVKSLPESYHKQHWANWRGGDFYLKVREYNLDISKLKALNVNILNVHSAWARYGTAEPVNCEDFKRFVKDCHKNNIAVVPYFILGQTNPHGYDIKQGDRKYSWTRLYGGFNKMPPIGAGKSRENDRLQTCPGSLEWRKYLFHSIKKAFEVYDVDGLYLDNAWPFSCKNAAHGCGYTETDKLREETFPILASRDLLKRVYYYIKGLKKKTYISFHTSKKMYLPLFSFCDGMLEGEEYFVKENFKNFKLDSLQVFFGRQWGLLPEFLCHHPFAPETAIYLSLLFNAMPIPLVPYGEGTGYSMRYEKLLFMVSQLWKLYDQFGIDNAQWISYEKSNCLGSISNNEIKLSAYVKNGEKALLIFFNGSRKEENATIKINLAKLGFNSVCTELLEITPNNISRKKVNYFDTPEFTLTFKPLSGYILKADRKK